jgi:UDP-N-acetylglucosamine/UDP-N-acetylgalactosamine diphosphorylase
VVILAGGQGSRLGFDHPKGMYNIGLPSNKSIFQILAERFLKIQMLAHGHEKLTPASQKCKMLIMTSALNHNETVKFFKDNKYFGGQSTSFIFFQQAVIPAVDTEGKIIMKTKSELCLSPNGNGGFFEAVNSNKLVKSVIEKTEYVQVIGVDNVLNKILDPLQIGFMAGRQLEASLKCCIKRDPAEKVGVVLKKNGKYDIVEYSELSEEQANRPDDDGGL